MTSNPENQAGLRHLQAIPAPLVAAQSMQLLLPAVLHPVTPERIQLRRTKGIRAELRGHDLACWCPLDQPCHADVLIEVANA